MTCVRRHLYCVENKKKNETVVGVNIQYSIVRLLLLLSRCLQRFAVPA